MLLVIETRRPKRARYPPDDRAHLLEYRVHVTDAVNQLRLARTETDARTLAEAPHPNRKCTTQPRRANVAGLLDQPAFLVIDQRLQKQNHLTLALKQIKRHHGLHAGLASIPGINRHHQIADEVYRVVS